MKRVELAPDAAPKLMAMAPNQEKLVTRFDFERTPRKPAVIVRVGQFRAPRRQLDRFRCRSTGCAHEIGRTTAVDEFGAALLNQRAVCNWHHCSKFFPRLKTLRRFALVPQCGIKRN